MNREVDTDLFSAVVHHIVGQQISTKAQATIWQRMRGALGTVDACLLYTSPDRRAERQRCLRRAGRPDPDADRAGG